MSKKSLLLFFIFCLLQPLYSFTLAHGTGKATSEIYSSYNQTTSRDYTILGVASYCDHKCLSNWTCQITKNYLKNDKIYNVTFLMGTLTRAAGFVAYDATKNLIVISLRGSANIQNWISDFTFDAVAYSKCKNCKIHVGFMEDYHSIQKKMFEAVSLLIEKYPTASFLTTGHSMGAALSVIVGLEVKLRYPESQLEIHNLGCPRVGNAEFSQFVTTKVDRIFRLVHYRDLIVHLPPLEFGYHHSAYEVFFDKGMENYTICNESGQDNQCSNKFFPQYNPADHGFYFWDLGKILKC